MGSRDRELLLRADPYPPPDVPKQPMGTDMKEFNQLRSYDSFACEDSLLQRADTGGHSSDGSVPDDTSTDSRPQKDAVEVDLTVEERGDAGGSSICMVNREMPHECNQDNTKYAAPVVYCSRCGAPNEAAARFCVRCGNPLATIVAQSSDSTISQGAQRQSSYKPPTPYGSSVETESSSQYGNRGAGALVCGILSIVLSFFFLSIVGLILGIIGAVMSSTAKKAGIRNGITTGAMVTSIIGLVLSVIGLVGCTVAGGAALNYGLANIGLFL